MHSTIFTLNDAHEGYTSNYEEYEVGKGYSDYVNEYTEEENIKSAVKWLADDLAETYSKENVILKADENIITLNRPAVVAQFYKTAKEKTIKVAAELANIDDPKEIADTLRNSASLDGDLFGWHIILEDQDFTLDAFIQHLRYYDGDEVSFKVSQVFDYHC